MTIIIIIFVILVSGCKNNSINNPNDPLFPKQWYLKKINWLPVYQSGITGRNIRVNITGDGFDPEHPDLRIDPVVDAQGIAPLRQGYGNHGTPMAGLVAARCNNHIGICGVAPGATLIFNDLLLAASGGVGMDRLIESIQYDTLHSDISVNSWGGEDSTGQYQSMVIADYHKWRDQMEAALHSGRNGKGIVFIWSAGNGTNKFNEIDNSNYDSFANLYGVIPVCTVDKNGHRSVYSERGANLWVCAPSSSSLQGDNEVITTANDDSYTSRFGGTSASAAIVGGVVALMLEANPDLTWRDVKVILAKSATVNDPKSASWQENGGNLLVSHEYGFGAIDAHKAVDLSKKWKNIPELKVLQSTVSQGHSIVLTVGEIQFIEYIEVQTQLLQDIDASDLNLILESPAGTKSYLHDPHECRKNLRKVKCRLPARWYYGTSMHLGEKPEGKWNLVAESTEGGRTLPVEWSLKIYGHRVSSD